MLKAALTILKTSFKLEKSKKLSRDNEDAANTSLEILSALDERTRPFKDKSLCKQRLNLFSAFLINEEKLSPFDL